VHRELRAPPALLYGLAGEMRSPLGNFVPPSLLVACGLNAFSETRRIVFFRPRLRGKLAYVREVSLCRTPPAFSEIRSSDTFAPRPISLLSWRLTAPEVLLPPPRGLYLELGAPGLCHSPPDSLVHSFRSFSPAYRSCSKIPSPPEEWASLVPRWRPWDPFWPRASQV